MCAAARPFPDRAGRSLTRAPLGAVAAAGDESSSWRVSCATRIYQSSVNGASGWPRVSCWGRGCVVPVRGGDGPGLYSAVADGAGFGRREQGRASGPAGCPSGGIVLTTALKVSQRWLAVEPRVCVRMAHTKSMQERKREYCGINPTARPGCREGNEFLGKFGRVRQ